MQLTLKVEEPLLLSPIETFYKDKSVFITGATGFMGKVGFSWNLVRPLACCILLLLLGLGVFLVDYGTKTVWWLLLRLRTGVGGETSAKHPGGKDLPSDKVGDHQNWASVKVIKMVSRNSISLKSFFLSWTNVDLFNCNLRFAQAKTWSALQRSLGTGRTINILQGKSTKTTLPMKTNI